VKEGRTEKGMGQKRRDEKEGIIAGSYNRMDRRMYECLNV